MDFTVYTTDGVDSYEGATYAVDSEGVGTLQIRTAEGKVVLYSSTGWRRLEVPPSPPPSPPPPPSAAERIEQLRQEAAREQREDMERARRRMDFGGTGRPEG